MDRPRAFNHWWLQRTSICLKSLDQNRKKSLNKAKTPFKKAKNLDQYKEVTVAYRTAATWVFSSQISFRFFRPSMLVSRLRPGLRENLLGFQSRFFAFFQQPEQPDFSKRFQQQAQSHCETMVNWKLRDSLRVSTNATASKPRLHQDRPSLEDLSSPARRQGRGVEGGNEVICFVDFRF